MQFESTVTIAGAKRGKGEIDGKSYDSTKIYVETKMDASKGDAMGSATTEYLWGLFENYSRISHLKPPFQALVTFEQVTNGKTIKTIVIDVKPVPAPQAAKA